MHCPRNKFMLTSGDSYWLHSILEISTYLKCKAPGHPSDRSSVHPSGHPRDSLIRHQVIHQNIGHRIVHHEQSEITNI